MTEFVFNVWVADDIAGEPYLFARREDAEEYAALYVGSVVTEETVMDETLAAGFIAEAQADAEADRQ